MNTDTPTNSLGDHNTVPLTPKDTPTSADFPQSVFETPGANQGNFDDLSGWTPRFAEEYSVFNTTPGNLRGASGPFPDLSVSTPYQPSASHKRLLSAGSIAVDIASHANHHSPTSALPLPPVDPSRRLPSSPTAARPFPSPIEADIPSGLQRRFSKKVRSGTSADAGAQTVTPPPSARKGERRLAPKPRVNSMQHDEFDPEFVADVPQQQQQMLSSFVSAPIEMFGMPLSAPATASTFDDTQGFWDAGMSGMDLDFSITATDSFHSANHRPMDSMDWAKTNEMFQETGAAPSKNQELPPQKKGRLLAPKPAPLPTVDASMTEAPVLAQSFHIPTDDPFPPSNSVGGGVDPGLLFTRPPSSNMELAAFDPMAQPIVLNSLPSPQLPPPVQEPKRGQVRRSASSKDVSRTKKDERVTVGPIVTSSSRPGLLRSASETRGRKPISRAGTLSNLAPAIRNGAPANGVRSASQGSRVSGRTSPLKIHQRLSSLTSIPEHNGPRTRTSVRFTIDSRGRARAETTVVVDNEQTPTNGRRRGEQRKKEWESSEDESSSTDDEPIIIPSRNSSFALPESRPPSYVRPSHTSQRSFSDQGTGSLGIYYADRSSSQGDADSDAETVMNMPVNNRRGDAMSELRKVRENRQKRVPTLNTNTHSVLNAPLGANSTISTPSTDGGNQIRCVCHTTLSHINGDGYMVQCESCEMWLHGKCVKITRQTLPRVYICAFCANTPNARNARGRGTQRGHEGPTNRTSATSPLAHKSLRSFR